MPTESEQKWLEDADNCATRYGWAVCRYCEHFNASCDEWMGHCAFIECPVLKPDWQDAAEFEAQVAASIAQDAHNCSLDEMTAMHREGDKPQGWYILRDARLVIEEEMDI